MRSMYRVANSGDRVRQLQEAIDEVRDAEPLRRLELARQIRAAQLKQAALWEQFLETVVRPGRTK